MADSVTSVQAENQNAWGDVLRNDTLFGPVVKGMFWGGFAVMAIARIVIAIASLVTWNDATQSVPGSVATVVVFLMIDTFGSLIFSAAMTAAGLVQSRLPAWARVTFISVASLILVGSNIAGAVSLSQFY